jgi:hypothetical protein
MEVEAPALKGGEREEAPTLKGEERRRSPDPEGRRERRSPSPSPKGGRENRGSPATKAWCENKEDAFNPL